jgi:tRNA A-37 threonylcarbamoyl transferase component Bud32
MHDVKDTRRASVRIGYDGLVHKRYFGPGAEKRFENEVKILRYLESKNCTFVPRLIEVDPEKLYIVTTNCGTIVEKISTEKLNSLFCALEQYGVKHGDPFMRNVTYDSHSGRFCVIDFEFATNLSTGEGLKLEDIQTTNELIHPDE